MCLRIVPQNLYAHCPVGMNRFLEDRDTLGMGFILWQGRKKDSMPGGICRSEGRVYMTSVGEERKSSRPI